jgi:hypothetical protein
MRSWLRHGAALLALAGGLAVLAVQNSGTSRSEVTDESGGSIAALASLAGGANAVAEDPADDTTGSIGTAGRASHDLLALSDEQRGLIFLGVINLPDVPDADLSSRTIPVSLSTAVELHDLPAMVTSRIPRVRDYKFVKLEDRILVVNPDNRVVVAEIPRYRLVH